MFNAWVIYTRLLLDNLMVAFSEGSGLIEIGLVMQSGYLSGLVKPVRSIKGLVANSK